MNGLLLVCLHFLFNRTPDSLWVRSVPVFYRGALGTERIVGAFMSGNLQRTVSVGVQRNNSNRRDREAVNHARHGGLYIGW